MVERDRPPHAALGSVTEDWFALEDRLNLMSLEVAGIRIWERLRFPLHMRLLRTLGVYEEPGASLPQNAAMWRNRIRWALNCNPWRIDPTQIVFIGTPRRKLGADATWSDVYCDPVMDRLPDRSTYLEPTSDDGHRQPTRTRSPVYEERLTLRARLAAIKPIKLTE
jgi:hypothetical protein